MRQFEVQRTQWTSVDAEDAAQAEELSRQLPDSAWGIESFSVIDIGESIE